MSEKEENKQTGAYSKPTRSEFIVVMNPAQSSESSVSCDSYDKIDMAVANIGKEPESSIESANIDENPQRENIQVSEHQEVHTVPRATQGGKVSRKRQEVFWEPLLVPSEIDGKVEMVTALKRVDSNFISGPKSSPKIVNTTKETKFYIPSKTKSQQPSVQTNTYTKIISPKVSSEQEVKHGVKKDITTKRKISELCVNEQMGKAIAEKEAAILREIEKAMKEASNIKSKGILQTPDVTKSKAVMSSDLSKSRSSVKVVPTQADIMKNVDDMQESDVIVPDVLKQTTGKADEGKMKAGLLKSFLGSSNIEVTAVTRMQTAPIQTALTSPALGSVGKEMQELCSVRTTSGRVVTVPTTVAKSPAKAVTKETQPVSTILRVPGTVVVSSPSSGVMSVPTDVQAFSNVVCGPATVFTSPISTNPIPTKDTVNKLITVPVNTMSNQQTMAEIPRIVFLASPTTTLAGGSLPLLTPILPASNLPLLHTPVSSYSRSKTRSPVKSNKSRKAAESKSMKERNPSVTLPKSPLPNIALKPASVDGTGTHTVEITCVGNSVTDLLKNTAISENNASMKTQVSSSHIAPSLIDTSYQDLAIAPKKSCDLNNDENVGEKVTMLKSGSIEQLEKNEPKANLLGEEALVTVNDKTNLKYSTEQNVASEKNVQKNDKGENMDVDEELISEELDQAFVDDTRCVIGQNVVAAQKSKNSPPQGKRSNSKEQKHLKRASKKALQKPTGLDISEDMLENRLQRMELLYNEIPSAKSRIALSDDDFSKIRDSFRDSMRVIKSISASFTNLIGQTSSLGNKKYTHSSCQTETNIGSESEVVSSVNADEKSGIIESDLIICRLCGGFFKKDSVIFLFGTLSKKRNILSMLSTILPQTSVKETDGLPQQVCKPCVDKLTLCHSIINQFLQADKELRQVLEGEKPSTADSSSSEENLNRLSHISSDESVRATAPNKKTMQMPPGEMGDSVSTNQHQSKESTGSLEHTQVQPPSQKRTCTVVDSERSYADNGLNHKRKRRRSKSPLRSSSDLSVKTFAPSKSSGCIDLSRLDPEFNDGFEVEWCLDEETIRSSMIPEEDIGSALNGDLAIATVPLSAENISNSGKGCSTKFGMRGNAEILSGASKIRHTANSQKKAKDKDSLRIEASKLKDEVSKLSEMHTSVCETSEKSDLKESPVSAVLEERRNVEPNDIPLAPEKIDYSSCSVSFLSKQEVFLNSVVHHKEQLPGDKQTPAQGTSSAVQNENLSQKQISPSVSKIGNESSEESVMCDECGLPFPNELSLNVHKCIVHESLPDYPVIIKDSKGLEYKIIVNSNETPEENLAPQEMPEVPPTDEKILVKCGNGMLWINSSKFFSEEQMSSVKSTEPSGVTFLNAQNDHLNVVSSEPSVSNVSSQNIAKVQFAYKCDHCKQIFVGKSDLLTHMQSHLQEVNCRECGGKFPSVKELNNHLPSHVPPDCVCEDCGLILLDSKKLLQHRKEHIHNFPHVCETCGKRFPNEQTLEVHETVHYNKKGPLACSLCRKCFFFKHSLVRHRSQHASNRLQKCSLCFRILNSSDQLRKHVALHHLMKNFVCFCKQTFPSQKELVEHRYLKHSYAEIFCARNKVEIIEPLPLHQCSICFRVLNSKQSLLKHHVTSHGSTWPFYCIQCSRKYTTMFYLARHECHRKYMSAYQCRICGKAFQNRLIFRQHKRIHDNRKWKYICRHCGKAYQKSQSLVAHIMTHGGKRFSCPRCHQPCQDKEGLLKHYNNGSCQLKHKTVQ